MKISLSFNYTDMSEQEKIEMKKTEPKTVVGRDEEPSKKKLQELKLKTERAEFGKSILAINNIKKLWIDA